MELFQTDDHYIVQDGQHSLWCSRSDGKLIPQEGKLFTTFDIYICTFTGSSIFA